ncbi:HNH endonuclease signature motif containing protein [Arthrobacter sp. HLT1-20]
MGTQNWPGSSEDSNLSGPSIQGHNLDAAFEAYLHAATAQPPDPFSVDPVTGEPRMATQAALPTWEELQAQADADASLYYPDDSGGGGPEPVDDESAFMALVEADALQQRGDPLWDGDAHEGQASAQATRKLRINVLRAAEPLTMPPPVNVKVYGGLKRVERLLPVMTAQEQAEYVPWTAQRGVDALDAIDPGSLGDDDLLSYIQATERQSSWAMARQSAAIAEFSTRRPPVVGEQPPANHPDRSRYAAAELMALFAIGVGAAERLICDAELLTRHLPDTFSQFADGSLDARRVRAIVQGTHNTPAELLHQIEPRLLRSAMNTNPNALLRKVRAAAEKINPEPLQTRHQRARTERDVWLTPLDDGMAYLAARLPAVEATLFFNSIDSWARNAKSCGEDSHGTTPTGRPSRSLNEYRADVLMDLLHQALLHPSGCGGCGQCEDHPRQAGGPFFKKRIPATINVTVSDQTLLGLSSQSAILAGYGPIPAEQARELAATATFWRRFLANPDTGRVTSIGRKSRKPPKSMGREVRLKDPVCTGIGCDRPAASCELDHTRPFGRYSYSADGTLLPLGETSLENLRPRCPYCHHAKDDPHTGWTVENVGPGVTRTTTPTGRVYLQTQGDIEAPF